MTAVDLLHQNSQQLFTICLSTYGTKLDTGMLDKILNVLVDTSDTLDNDWHLFYHTSYK
jgi:hypothetical protein